MVFLATNASNKPFALKRLMADSGETHVLRSEFHILKQLSGHPNIIRYVDSSMGAAQRQMVEAFLLTEYCPGVRRALSEAGIN